MNLQEIVRAAIFGIAIGDALGVPAEFVTREDLKTAPITGMRGGGYHDQKPGTWSDDTSMTLALMDSLTQNGFDPEDQMRRYVDWLWNANYTAYNDVFDVGGTVKSAIFRFCKGTPVQECGEDGDLYCGNGSLMRIIPMALYLYGIGRRSINDESIAMIHTSSAVTHANPRCLMACGIYCAVAFRLCSGEDPHDAVQNGVQDALSYYDTQQTFAGEMDHYRSLTTIETWPEQIIRGDGYVLHTLQAALWCFVNTNSYASCVLQAVNLGDDADTTAAVAGGLAGLYYGEENIPSTWLDILAKREEIRNMCDSFAASLMQ